MNADRYTAAGRSAHITTAQTITIAIVASLVLAGAVMVFRANLAAYWRISGYAANLALCKALTFAAVMSGVILLSWWLPRLFLESAKWRVGAAVLLYPVLMRVLGAPLIAVARRLIHRRYHLEDIP